MKKILIIMPSLFIGGAERSLIGLLEAFDYTKVEVSLFLHRHEGEFLRYIPQQVRLLPEIPEYRTFDTPIRSLLTVRKLPFFAARLGAKVADTLRKAVTKQYSYWIPMQYISRALQPFLPRIPGQYDLALNFLGVADVLIHKVDAKVKLTWCHSDYDTVNPDRKMDLQVYDKLDGIVNVSESCTEKFCRIYPQLRSKALTIENVLAAEMIRKEAAERVEDMPDHSGFTLLSIGRFNEIKNFHNIPFFCKYLTEQGLDVKWYIIGYGQDEDRIRRSIADAGMEERVFILGKKVNPYPYIAKCDLYVQPSLLEGKCVTVREAQLLGKPVVITRYATSASQLEEGVDGLIVPLDNDGCAAGIAELLRDPERMRAFSRTCTERDYSNAEETEKLYRLLE